MPTLGDALEGFTPRVLLTLGSGLGALAEEVVDARVFAAEEVGLPGTGVPGHAGRLLAGTLAGTPVLVQQGRPHLYEGHSAAAIAECVRAAAGLGTQVFIVTNAAGGLDPMLAPGDLLALRDHLNLTGQSPLVGVPGDGGAPAFVDMGAAYDPALRALARTVASEAGVALGEGIYAGVTGPAYETPAEAAMLRGLGADAVGMSTVCEVVAARALGLRVLGFSLVTNVHRPGVSTDHEEVLAAGAAGGPRLAAIVRGVMGRLAP